MTIITGLVVPKNQYLINISSMDHKVNIPGLFIKDLHITLEKDVTLIS
jgi:hypothetical protein